MHRPRSIAAPLVLSFVAATAYGQNLTVRDASRHPSIDNATPGQLLQQRMGIQVVVVDQSQLVLPEALAAKYRGGLRVINVVGPLAKLANLKAGDTVVAIEDVAATSVEAALRALDLPGQALGVTNVALLRGAGEFRTNLMLAPLADQAVEKRCGEMYELLAQELQQVERLQKQLGPAETAARRTQQLRAQVDIVHQQIVTLEEQLTTNDAEIAMLDTAARAEAEIAKDDKIKKLTADLAGVYAAISVTGTEDRTARQTELGNLMDRRTVLENKIFARRDEIFKAFSVADPHVNREELARRMAEAVQQRDDVERTLETLEVQVEKVRKYLDQLDNDTAELESRRHRVLLLQQALERRISELRDTQQRE